MDNRQSNSYRLREALDELLLHNPMILSALVVSDDGLNVGSGLHHDEDDAMALTASDLVDAAHSFSQKLSQGPLTGLVLEGEQRTSIILKAGENTVLAVTVPADEKLGIVTQASRRTARRIASIFA